MTKKLSGLYNRQFGRRMDKGSREEQLREANLEFMPHPIPCPHCGKEMWKGKEHTKECPILRPVVDPLRDTIYRALGKRAEQDEWVDMIDDMVEEAKNANEYGAIHVSDARGDGHSGRLQYYRCIEALKSVYYRCAAAIRRRGHRVKDRIATAVRHRLGRGWS